MSRQRRRFLLASILIGVGMGSVFGALATWATGTAEIVVFAILLIAVVVLVAPSHNEVFR